MADFKPDFAWLLKRPLCFLAFGFGSGLAPFAPGTFGTLAALPLAFVLILAGVDGWLLALLCAVLFVWGIRICACAEKESGVSDHGGIVWDEIVAMMFVLAFVPFKWAWWLAAFVLFRLFDALKPPPVGWFDKNLHGGLGIMADDMAAAVMTLIVLRIAMLF
ncbi:phosphatidylglycerophosphatase A [Neisseria lactamica]|uniref:phosphatidylglycerophosphatase A family protein n=1 Tax=Neisseria lactamica TaxID=486 RepID=UPI000E57A5ED|nr:phosphatidylglycerophosphatase A [Neisseria lactamica]